MSIESKIAALKARWLEERSKDFDFWLAWCESPIEQMFLAHYLCSGWRSPSQDEFSEAYRAEKAAGIEGNGQALCPESGETWLVVQPTVTLEGVRNRLDFAFLVFGEKLAIELDGHDFHERTKTQAQRDKSRDRRFARAGWKVLRFTGSEIYGDMDAVYDEVDEHLQDAVDRAHAEWETQQARARKS